MVTHTKFTSWLRVEFNFGARRASTNSKEVCVVDPSDGLQTSTFLCVTSCTAHIQQVMVIHLHSLMCNRALMFKSKCSCKQMPIWIAEIIQWQNFGVVSSHCVCNKQCYTILM